MVRRGVALVLILVLAISFATSNTASEIFKPRDFPDDSNVFEISYDVHEPFNITSDNDFETQGWPGNGSAIDPYLIQNLNITSTDSVCIWVMNTTSHFIIEDCLFSSSIDGYAFYQPIAPLTLTNVSNGIVKRNHIVDSLVAVSGYRLSNCSIADNSFSIVYYGIYLTFCNSTVISNNTQGYDACFNGICLAHCRNCTVSLNEFWNITTIGLDSWSNYDIHIVENTFRASTGEYAFSMDGIRLWGEFCTIQGNVVSDFGFRGIDVSGRNHTVKENNITSCDGGIVVRTNNSTIIGNRINGSFLAIEIVQSNDTIAYENVIFGRLRYGTGISIYGGNDCDIYSNNISQVAYGIYLQGATRFNITGNSVTDGRYGFVFGWSSQWGVSDGQFFDCDIVDNAFDGGGVFPAIENYESWEFDTIRFEGNTVHGEPIGFFTDLNQETIDGNTFAQLLLVRCTEITISGGNFHDISSDTMHDIYYDPGIASAITLVNCTTCNLVNVDFHSNTYGITLQDSTQCGIADGSGYYNSWIAISISDSKEIEIANVEIRNNLRGIDLSWSYNCHIEDCQVENNGEGIVLEVCFNTTIIQNNVHHNNDAIFLGDSDGSEIRSNSIFMNERGILLNSTSDCLITQNIVANNTGVGICLDNTSNRNEIFNNTFVYNSPNAICEGSLNNWDNQVDTGNWWSDYSGEGVYIIDENDQDNFPLTNETTTTNGTTSPWTIDPLLLGSIAGVTCIIILIAIIIQRRRIVVIE
ncbi:MAG: right-handed parallel beta-helix repeat-containing protein [Candidatus Thorarchaeota archaeon]